ncbi:hypothetical protein Rs2_38541 [Raphanus sativus]|nr:hypothetical protein Rs2_38541 [Raphanus sativus]
MGVSSVFTVRPRTSSLCSPLILDQNGFRFASIGVFFKILRRKQSHCPGCKRPAAATIARVSSPKSLDLGKQSHCLGCKRPAPATITRVSSPILLDLGQANFAPLCCPLILDQNGFRFASIEVSIEILRRKQSHCLGCKRPAPATITRVSSPMSLDLGQANFVPL